MGSGHVLEQLDELGIVQGSHLQKYDSQQLVIFAALIAVTLEG
jgi:hypothetical protein